MASSPRVPKLERWPEPLQGAFHDVETALRSAQPEAPASVMRVVGSVNRLLRVLDSLPIPEEMHRTVRARVDDLMVSVRTLLDGVTRKKDDAGRRMSTLGPRR